MSAVIEREGKAPIVINAPTDPALKRLWDLAESKVGARGKSPETKADWHAVQDEYHAMLGKQRGSIGQVIREICEKAPGGD